MPGVYLYGWDAVNEVWVKIECTADGIIKVDPALLLENPPVENESKKAATSEWSYDHWKNTNAHHPETLTKTSGTFIYDGADNPRTYPPGITLSYVNAAHGWPHFGTVITSKSLTIAEDAGTLQIYVPDSVASGGNYCKIRWGIDATGGWTAWQELGTLPSLSALKLYGTLYWSCSGNAFSPRYPYNNNVSRSTTGILIMGANNINCICPVNLPDGATVTAVVVYGNAAATAETWYLSRVAFSDKARTAMATGAIETEDTTISNPVIDNSLYGYFFRTSSLDIDNEIWGAEITYTL